MPTTHTISDLSCALPAQGLSNTPKAGHWRLADYACGTTKGKLLFAGPLTCPPQIELPLGLTGWHRLTIGLWGGSYMAVATRLKLTGEPCFRTFRREKPSNETIEETPFGCADLTGRNLIIGPPADGTDDSVTLAYVRCEPLSPEEVQHFEADRSRTDCRKVIAYNDGIFPFATKEDLQAVIEPYRHSDVGTLFWGMTGDITTFPTKHGRMVGTGMDDFPSRSQRRTIENIHKFNAAGMHPVKTALELAHDAGLEFHIYQRMGAGTHHVPQDAMWTSDFYAAHPEWRCVNREGVHFPRLSFAYPEVRRHWLDLLVEVAGFGVDGVNLCFMRGPAFVGYEQPLVDGFKAKFGQDPCQLDEWDDNWLRYRAWPMTEFVRELRVELDAVGEKLGKRLQLSTTSFPTEPGNVFYGLDLEAWIAEGLVDRLTPYGISRLMDYVDLPYYVKLTKDTQCSFWPHLPVVPSLDVCNTAGSCRAKALEYYDGGAEGLAIWDMDKPYSRSGLGPALDRLGHIDEMRAIESSLDKPDEPVVLKLDQLGDLDMRVYSIPETHTDRLYPKGVPCHIVWWPS